MFMLKIHSRSVVFFIQGQKTHLFLLGAVNENGQKFSIQCMGTDSGYDCRWTTECMRMCAATRNIDVWHTFQKFEKCCKYMYLENLLFRKKTVKKTYWTQCWLVPTGVHTRAQILILFVFMFQNRQGKKISVEFKWILQVTDVHTCSTRSKHSFYSLKTYGEREAHTRFECRWNRGVNIKVKY